MLVVVSALAGCGRGPAGGRQAAPGAASAPESAAGAPSPAKSTLAVVSTRADTVPRYGAYPLTGERALRALEDSLGAEDFARVLKLNRLDPAHARQGDTLVVPGRLEWPALSPFPLELPAARAVPKLLLVSARVQAFAAYESGRQVRWGPASTGRREMPTPPALYHTNWRQRTRKSTFNDEWVLHWYFNLQNFNGISVHEYELPGRPASHSCVRLLEDDAAWIYDWAEEWQLVPGDRRRIAVQGTPVLVLDTYAFGRRRPWKRLPEDPHATDVDAAEVEAALARWQVTGPAGREPPAATDPAASADSLAR